MKQLPAAPAQYSKEDQASLRRLIQEELLNCVKKNEEWNAVRLVLTDEATGTRYELYITGGVISKRAV